MIGIIDYGAGNLRSIVNSVTKVGGKLRIDVVVSSDVNVLKRASKLILPGVGAFGEVMRMLKLTRLDTFVKDWILSGKKFMGICVGLQVLFDVGYENGVHEGLGIFRGEVVRFSRAQPVPHMGWNQIVTVNESPFLSREDSGKYFYFVHSYYVRPLEERIINTLTEYDGEVFASSIFWENVFAVQFHPEKSHINGEEVIKKFLADF